MKNIKTFEYFKNEDVEELTKESKIESNQKEMYDGIVDILKRVRDVKNRREIADHMMVNFKKEKIDVEEKTFLKDVGLFNAWNI